MFSVITNIYNKKTKGPTFMELFAATGNLKKFFFTLEMFDVCITGDTAHVDTTFRFLSHMRQHVDTCVARTWMCAVSPVVHSSNISSVKKNFFGFPVAVNNSIRVGPLVFLL